MKTIFYCLLSLGSFGALAAPEAFAHRALAETPTEKAAATKAPTKLAAAATASKARIGSSYRSHKAKAKLHHALLVLAGLEAKKAVTTPAERTWQLHKHQQHLKAKALQQARAHRRRLHK